MKILAIRGVNIASLAGSFEIDFTKEPLLSTGIFAITGPTGSGKSTILDVLSLALYENTPRLTKAGDTRIADVKAESLTVNNPATLMRRGTSEAIAEVDFIGIDGKNYRSTWRAYRGRQNVNNKIQPTTVELTNLDTNEVFPAKKRETLNEISRLVGLTFPQFTRTVVLAQGEFAQFLKANDTERASLLEKLTGTEIYSEISKRIYQRTAAVQSEFKELELRMGEHRLLSPEEFDTYQEQSASFKQQIKEAETLILQLNKLLDWFKKETDLQNTIQANQQEMAALIAEQQSQESDNCLLVEYNALTPAFQLLKNKTDLEAEKVAISYRINLLDKDIANKSIEKQEQERKLSDIKQEEDAFLKAEPAYDVLIENAQKHINTIDTTAQLLEAENSKNTKAIEDFNNCQNQITQFKQALAAAEAVKTEGENWLAKYSSRKDVVTNSSLIHHRLNQAGESNKLITSLKQQDIEETSQYQACVERIESIGKQCIAEDNAILELSQQLAQKRKEIADTNIESLKAQLNQEREQQEHLLALSRIQETALPLVKEKSDNFVEVQKADSDLSNLTIEAKKLEELLSIWKGKHEQQAIILNQIQQMASENVSNLRTTLKPETPCPVCGSLDHPYAHQVNSYFEELSSNALKAMEALTEEGKELNQKAENLRVQKTLLETNKNTLQLSNNRIDEKLLHLKTTWDNNPYASSFSFDQSDVESDKLQKSIDALKLSITQVTNKIDTFIEIDKVIRDKEALLNQKTQSLSDFKHAKEKLELEKQKLEDSKKKIQAQIAELTQKVNDDLSSIDSYFNSRDWRNNWMKDAAAFKSLVDTFVANWNDTTQRVEKNRALVSQYTSNIEIETRNLQNLEKTKELIADKITELKTKIDTEKQQLNTLTNNRSIESIQQKHRAKKEELTNALKDNQNKLNTITELYASLNGQKTTLLQHQNNTNDQLQNATTILNNWLAELNAHREDSVQEATLQQYMSISPDTIDRISSNKKRIEEQLVVVKTQLALNTDNQTKHTAEKAEDISYDETRLRLSEAENQKKLIFEQLQEVDSKLLQHKNSCEALAGLRTQIESKKQEVNNWLILNKEIGSAEGTSFKRIAQSYTLDLLLLTANAQIQLIAPRYQLQRIPDSLSLQVIDRDMCDQIRSVHSLSGGETFLVSLALALGLSSLSSSQMNIESLFIDEGFGSLDEESLMMAMDALESLRLQGRKVGVITHVKEMTERISTRIRVNKVHNGASEICIES